MEINYYFGFKINKYKKIIGYFSGIRNYQIILKLQLQRLIFFKKFYTLLHKKQKSIQRIKT